MAQVASDYHAPISRAPNFLRAHHGAPSNEHIKTSLVNASCIAMQLIAEGFTVLGVHVGRRNPVIKIQPGPATALLRGTQRMQRLHSGRREEGFIAIRDGVQIEWEEERSLP